MALDVDWIDLGMWRSTRTRQDGVYEKTGCPSVVNTSFNMHEEPIVRSPEDALRAWQAAELDAMILGPYVVTKN